MRLTVRGAPEGTLSYQGSPDRLGCTSRTVAATPDDFTVHQCSSSARPLYYRARAGGLAIADVPADLADGPVSLSDTQLMGLVYGAALPPDATLWPGVRRLTVGDRIRVGTAGVTTSRLPVTPPDQDERSLPEAIAATLPSDPLIAFAGGLASTFLTLVAVRAGLRPTLVNIVAAGRPALPPLPRIDGAEPAVVALNPGELPDERQITGTEPQPPLPDVQFRRAVLRAVAEHGGHGPVVAGTLLQEAFQGRLADAELGLAGRRLLAAEPFHATGHLASLRRARTAVRTGSGDPRSAPQAAAEHLGQADECATALVTDAGDEAARAARTAATLIWRDRRRQLPTVTHRLESLIASRRLAPAWYADRAVPEVVYPALSPAVLGMAEHTPPGALVAIRRGRIVNSLPLAAFVGDLPVHRAGALARFRVAAAAYLAVAGPRIARDLARGSALVDRGLLSPVRLQAALQDGYQAAEVAVPLLRAVWLDRWLRER